MRVIGTLFTAAAALGGVACTSDPASLPGGSDAAAESGRYALVVLTHEHGEPGVAVSGQMMAFSGTTRGDALQALAVPEQAWLTQALPEDGACRFVEGGRAEVADGEAPRVDLLSVGEMAVYPPEPLRLPLLLPPRDFPLVLFSIGGVVYDADAPEQLPYLAQGAYRVEAPGDELGPVTGQVGAPAAVWLADVAPTDEGVRVRWEGGGQAVVLVSRDVGSASIGLICGDADGDLVLPTAALARLGGGPAQLIVARVQTAPLAVDGVDAAHLAFVARDTAELDLSELAGNP